MEKSIINHTARVVAINHSTVKVRIELPANQSECEGCALSSSCNPVRMHSGTIDANIPDGMLGEDLLGRRVEIETPCNMRVKATVQMLVMPLVVFIAVAVIMHVLKVEEGLSALIAISAAGLCYAVVNRL